MVKFEAFEEKGLINRTEYKYSVRLTDENIFAKFTYETERKKLDYMIVNNDVDGKYVARYEGEMISKKGNVEAIRGVSKSYTYDSLNRLKPLIPFKNLNGAVAYRNIKNFSNRYLPSYEDTFDLEVFGDRAYFKYNDKQQEELIKEYDKKQAIQVAFNSYIKKLKIRFKIIGILFFYVVINAIILIMWLVV